MERRSPRPTRSGRPSPSSSDLTKKRWEPRLRDLPNEGPCSPRQSVGAFAAMGMPRPSVDPERLRHIHARRRARRRMMRRRRRTLFFLVIFVIAYTGGKALLSEGGEQGSRPVRDGVASGETPSGGEAG